MKSMSKAYRQLTGHVYSHVVASKVKFVWHKPVEVNYLRDLDW